MDTIKYDQLTSSWKQIAKNEDRDLPPDFELEVYKKMLDIFHVGTYYYFIFNLIKAEVEFVSDSVKQVLGLEPGEFSPTFVYNNIHADDKRLFAANEQNLTTFFSQLDPEKVFNYKISYDYRLMRKDGRFIWIHQQMLAMQIAENGAIIRTLGVHTDVSHLKTEQKPIGMTILGLNGEPSFFNVRPNTLSFVLPADNELFTKREKEIYRLVMSGQTSVQIAKKLFISTQTVNTHRKNILKKAGCSNWIGFASTALLNGW